MAKKLLFITLVLAAGLKAYSQTIVQGTISSNTTWSLANSPYIVNANILVNSGVTLTVEAGVIVKVNQGLKIEIKGEIIAIGTPSSKITFTSNKANPYPGDWLYINILSPCNHVVYDSLGNYQSGSIFKHVDIQFCGSVVGPNSLFDAVNTDCAAHFENINITYVTAGSLHFTSGNGGKHSKILNSTFADNNNAISGYLSSSLIEDCHFLNNHTDIRIRDTTYGYCVIRNNIFEANKVTSALTGISLPSSDTGQVLIERNIFNFPTEDKFAISFGTSHARVRHNIFLSPGYHGFLGPYDYQSHQGIACIDSNVFSGNNDGLLKLRNGITSLSFNHICHNRNTSDLITYTGNLRPYHLNFEHNTVCFNDQANSTSPVYLFDGTTDTASFFKVNHNNLFYNRYANTIAHFNTSYFNAEYNYWGDDTANIDQLIFDGNDHLGYGVVDYHPFLFLPDTTSPISPPNQVVKKLSGGSVQIQWEPNPEPDIAGYKIYWGNPTGYSYSNSIDVGDTNNFTLPNTVSLSSEIAITAYDNLADGMDDLFEGHESWFTQSNEFNVSVNTSQISCHGAQDGQITLNVSGGTYPYNYQWLHDQAFTSNTISYLGPGTYYYTVSDDGWLNISDSVILLDPDSLNLSSTSTDIQCAGANDGIIIMNATGGTPPYQYSIDNGQSFSSRSLYNFLAPGTYFLEVKDSRNCYSYDTVTIVQLGTLSLILDSISDADCKLANDGAIAVTASGGVLPYSYSWSNGDTVEDILNLTAGTYNLILSDSTGCTQNLSVVVSEPPALIHSITANDVSCYNAPPDGSISNNVSGGTPPYSYSWSHDPNNFTSSAQNLDSGTYIVNILDDNFCSISDTIQILRPDSIQISSITVHNANCNNTGDGIITFKATGGVLPYMYRVTHSNGSLVGLSDSISNLSDGSYTLEVRDANLCYVDTTNIIVGVNNTIIRPNIVVQDSTVCTGFTTSLTMDPGILQATWNDGYVGTSRSVGIGTYWATTTDTNGCPSTSDTITIGKKFPKDTTSSMICLVTYDRSLGLNKIVFEKPDDEYAISTYNVYKEDIFGVWQLLGTVNNGDSSQFVDANSQPQSRTARYYLVVKDQCNNSYPVSNYNIHKTVLLQSSIGSSNEVNLAWNSYEGASVWYYRILRKAGNGPFVPIDSVSASSNNFIDNNPPIGNTSYLIEAVLFSSCQVKAKTNTVYNSISSNLVTENTIGIEENLISHFQIYPNPSSGIVNVEHLGKTELKRVQLFDLHGKLLQEFNSTNQSFTIDLSHFAKGIYQLKIQVSGGLALTSIVRY